MKEPASIMTFLDQRPVFFFDIDNCLYSRNSDIHGEMRKLINSFFARHLSLGDAEAEELHDSYYKTYSLALEGLVRNHKIDPMTFNREVDDSLPLEALLEPNPVLRQLLESIDTSKVKLWLLTNAYRTHGQRVVKILGISHLFEGITYSDYSEIPLVCKPSQEMYAKAERESGAPSSHDCYFIDDSALNCVYAQKRGWTTVHLAEPGFSHPDTPDSVHTVQSIAELPSLFPDLFTTSIK